MHQPTRRIADLVIGTTPTRQFQFKQAGVAQNVAGWTFKGRLHLSAEDASPLLEINGVITDAPNGKVKFVFPNLTTSNTGGRDERLWRILVWTVAPGANPPEEILEFAVTVR